MVNAGLPNITGGFVSCVWSGLSSSKNGMFDINVVNNWIFTGGKTTDEVTGDTWRNVYISLNTKNTSNIYGASNTVTPLTYTVRAYICYA